MSTDHYSLGYRERKPKTFRNFLLTFMVVVAVVGGVGWIVVRQNSSMTIINAPGKTRVYPATKPAETKPPKR